MSPNWLAPQDYSCPARAGLQGRVSAALLVGVLPANVQMTVNAGRLVTARSPSPLRVAFLAGTVARLPLQWPLIRAAWRAGR